MESQRQRLIGLLSGYKKNKAHEITVVFDGWKNGSPSETKTVAGGIEVVYSRLGEKADGVIKRMLSAGRQHIVVSSDRDIQAYAWSHDSVPISAEDFLAVLERPDLGEPSSESGQDEYPNRSRKGSPKTLSKKDKARKKAIEKL